jgi:two-component system CheB/CheR fusion protein
METIAQAIVETVREPLLVLNEDLRIRSANHSFYRTFDASPDETVGRPLYELGDHQWDIPRLRDLLEHILPQDDQFRDFEVKHDFPNIGRRTMLLNARRLRRDGGAELILLAIEDITRRKHLERSLAVKAVRERELNEALRQQVAELDAFTYSVSHDLKEPLRAIEAFSQFVLEDCADQLDEQGQGYLTKLSKASIRMKNLIDDLLTLSRAFRQPGRPSRVDVDGLVKQIVAEAQLALDAKGATVEVEKGLPDVLAESTRMRQVFVNLLGNAIKFNESERPHVKIGVRSTEGDRATFYVQDNGIGIDPRYHERIFDIFQRLHPREQYEGTGAGLAVVERVVQTLGGTVWVESELGAGATFLFTLPLATEATASAQGKAA